MVSLGFGTETASNPETLSPVQIKELKDRFNLINDPNYRLAGAVCSEIAKKRIKEYSELKKQEMPVGDALVNETAQWAVEIYGFLRESLETESSEEWPEEPLYGLSLEEVMAAVEAVDARDTEAQERHG